jgi:hypothetical protein
MGDRGIIISLVDCIVTSVQRIMVVSSNEDLHHCSHPPASGFPFDPMHLPSKADKIVLANSVKQESCALFEVFRATQNL